LRPQRDVVARISDNRRFPCGATRSVNTNDFFQGYREHPEWVTAPQVILGCERQQAEILYRTNVLRIDAGRCKLVPIKGDLTGYSIDATAEALHLKSF